MYKIVWFIYFFGIVTIITGQEKIEVEKPIKHKEVPEKAKKFVCELLPTAKVNWIHEITNGDSTYEAKARDNGERYSIEFYTSGEFSDVELEIKQEVIAETVLQSIKKRFQNDFDKFRISKIQHHYSGNGEEVIKLLKLQKADLSTISQFFEIEVKALKDREIQHFQYVFTLEGTFVERLKIGENSSDNLFY